MWYVAWRKMEEQCGNLRGDSMAFRQRRYSKEELARCGHELYESGIQQKIEAGNEGKIMAIDQVKSSVVR
jgi:hypothetical protein